MSTKTNSAVTVHFLGEFFLTIDGRPIERWRAGKARSLFQYLMVNRNRIVVRERLYEVLWPDIEWSAGSSSLKVAAHALRQVLRIGDQSRGTSAADASAVRVVHRDFGYGLYADDMWVDIDEFHARFDEGRAADEVRDTAAAMCAYRAAMELYRGDFLAGERHSWVLEQREWHKAAALRVLERLRDDALQRGDYAELIRWCQRTLEIEPYREDTYQLLMWIHGRFGERERVKNWYQMCVQRLRCELDVEPTTDTHRVFSQALQAPARVPHYRGAVGSL
jgi:DNA-binding SARP family transcriptional activator